MRALAIRELLPPSAKGAERRHPEPYWKTRGAKLESCRCALSCTNVDGYAQAHTRRTKASALGFTPLQPSPVVASYVEASLGRRCSALGSSGTVLFVSVVASSCAVRSRCCS